MKQVIFPFLVAVALSSCTGETLYYNQNIDLEKYIQRKAFSNESDVSMAKHKYESALESVDFAKRNPSFFHLDAKKKELEKAKREYKYNLEDLRDKISDYLQDANATDGTQDTTLYIDSAILGITLKKHFEITTYRVTNVEYVEKRLKRLNEDLQELD